MEKGHIPCTQREERYDIEKGGEEPHTMQKRRKRNTYKQTEKKTQREERYNKQIGGEEPHTMLKEGRE